MKVQNNSNGSGSQSFEEVADKMAMPTSIQIWEIFGRNDGVQVPSEATHPQLQSELTQWFREGWNYKKGTHPVAVNPTMLQYQSGQYNVHYSACPFLSYLPLDKSQLEALWKQQKGDVALAVTTACQQQLSSAMRSFQSLCKRALVTMHAHCCDAMHATLYRFPGKRVATNCTHFNFQKAETVDIDLRYCLCTS